MGDYTASFPDTIVREVPLDAVSRKETVSTSPSEIPMAQFAAARKAQVELIGKVEQIAAGKIGLGLVTGRLEHALPGFTRYEQDLLVHERNRLIRVEMEPWRRWANGFSCLCFVLVGAPMAIRMRNSDFLTSFFMCFLPILLVYYPVFILGVDQAKRGAVPPIAVWLGNVLIVLWGWWLLRRVIRQ
jgi:lipopolysaccharide export system permease protein